MVLVLKVLLKFLHIIRDCIKRFPGRRAAFLGDKLIVWWRFWFGNFRRPKPAERPSFGIQESSYSVSGGSAVVKEYAVAASYVPASASHPSLNEHAERQPAAVPQTVDIRDPPIPGSISVDHPQAHTPSHPLGGGSVVNRSYGSLSAITIQSRASDRLSVITTSRGSIRAPLDQPSLYPRATHPQFGRGPDPSRSRERPTEPPAPTTRPVVQPPTSSSFTHEPLSPPPQAPQMSENRSSLVVDVQHPSTDSLPSSVVDLRNDSIDSIPGSPTSSNHPTLDYFIPEGRVVQLITSDQIPRYMKNATIPRVETAYDIKPLTTTFPYFPETNGSDQDSLQQGSTPWTPATHPDGALYFYDQERRLFTDTDMHNKTMRDEIEEFYNYLQRLIDNDQLSIPSKNYDLVLDITATEDSRLMWSYYYACHHTRCLFWLETYDATHTLSELFGVKSPSHVKHRLEALYWSHWSLFPVVFDDRHLPFEVYDELMGILMYGCIDVTTSMSSTLPYDDDRMVRWIRLVQGAKEAKGGLVYYTAGITRLLSFFAHWRFLYFHGQTHARLIKDQSVYDKPKRERSLLITFLSPLLFLAPEVHLREAEKLWTDEIIIERSWRSFMTKLLADWERVILWSTVMLTVNVGFLAIPGVVLSNLNGTEITSASQVVIFTSASQIASSLSVESNIGSIVIGLLLLRHNRSKQKEDPAGASTYLYQNSHRVFGLEPIAIIFSLPWALLMWSMMISLVALLLFCFSISNVSTRVSVASMLGLLATLTGWCIWAVRKSIENDDILKSNLAVFRRTGRVLLGRVKELNPFNTRHVPQRRRSEARV